VTTLLQAWREGGRYPIVDFDDLRDVLTHGYMYSYSQMRYIWGQILISSGASSGYSATNGIPALYSFVEEVNRLIVLCNEKRVKIKWNQVPVLALKLGMPGNWEFMCYSGEELI